jgi:hypothetical protein
MNDKMENVFKLLVAAEELHRRQSELSPQSVIVKFVDHETASMKATEWWVGDESNTFPSQHAAEQYCRGNDAGRVGVSVIFAR